MKTNQEKTSQLQSQIVEISDNTGRLTCEIEVLKGEKSILSSAKSRLEVENTTLQKVSARLEMDILNLNTEKTKLQREKTLAGSDKLRFEARIKDLQQESSELSTKIAEMKNVAEEAEAQLQKEENTSNRLRKERATAEASMKTTNDKLVECDFETSRLQTLLKATNLELGQSRMDIQELKEKFNSMMATRDSHDAIEKQLQMIVIEKQLLDKDREALQLSLEVARNEITQLRSAQIASSQADLSTEPAEGQQQELTHFHAQEAIEQQFVQPPQDDTCINDLPSQSSGQDPPYVSYNDQSTSLAELLSTESNSENWAEMMSDTNALTNDLGDNTNSGNDDLAAFFPDTDDEMQGQEFSGTQTGEVGIPDDRAWDMTSSHHDTNESEVIFTEPQDLYGI